MSLFTKEKVLAVLQKYYLALISGIIGGVTGAFFLGENFTNTLGMTIALAGLLGIPAFAAISFLDNKKPYAQIIGGAFLLAFGLLFYFQERDHITTIAFFMAAIAMAYLTPFKRSKNLKISKDIYIQYCENLSINILFTMLFGGIFWIGLMLLISALQSALNSQLFGYDYQPRIWFLITGIFCPIFFFYLLEHQEILKLKAKAENLLNNILTYLLLTLTSLYTLVSLIHFYNYLAGLGLNYRDFSWLILVLCFINVVVFHLLQTKTATNKYLYWISNALYAASVPALLLVIWITYNNISNYGINENRYYVLLFAVWYLVAIGLQVFTKAKNIKALPLSVATLAILSAVGPWSAKSLTTYTQGLKPVDSNFDRPFNSTDNQFNFVSYNNPQSYLSAITHIQDFDYLINFLSSYEQDQIKLDTTVSKIKITRTADNQMIFTADKGSLTIDLNTIATNYSELKQTPPQVFENEFLNIVFPIVSMTYEKSNNKINNFNFRAENILIKIK